MIVLITAIVGVLGVVGSLLFSGWQTRQLIEQSKLQNAVAGTTGVQQPMELLHGVLRMLFEEPSLRPYLYERKVCPPEGDERARVLTVAEMFGDVLEVGLHSTTTIASTDAQEDWLDYSRFLLGHSPTLVEVVSTHPRWYPALAAMLTEPALLGAAEAPVPSQGQPST
ncbi:hypothetical protein [Micromonospora sp. NPDC005197]|uniref:hypothetical protein n=1 Tax=Micromonospora sp. NPDC005197 TaxID=3157020 RepID=UPI0033B3E454